MVPLARRGGRPIARTSISITGIVQGVGFRPFVYRLASEMGLTGWVRNYTEGVLIEACSTDERLAHFIRRIKAEAPPLAVIASLEHHSLPDDCLRDTTSPSAKAAKAVDIPHTSPRMPPSAHDCLRELFDPANRRFRHPFITCTNCGPRYSIITGIPYDRPNTTMASFPLCPDCRQEYNDPADRRFHAQPIACPVCGPQLRLLDSSGSFIAENDQAIITAIELLKAGADSGGQGDRRLPPGR